ncbi:serine hydrolase domain-containing protein [Streptomyces iranensis]|uniref:Beta-lactamase n=1 Tax=Streptomyces iranensis TaxID=576784 RepID=A0A060ZFC3_9ACTN|nr:serine hydrolase domain-containing protein [Streptomyces iranensis]MBP2062050.1 CubicO group peptidase (beta-lactamase class C family) [Streptomyces iranensis]CDR04038.1 beta-lactamase [Streptomyces iranensis]
MPIHGYRRLFRLAIALLIAWTAVGRPATAHAATPTHPTLNAASIDAYVKAYMERTDLPGAVVAVTRGDQVVHAAGYGHTAAGKAMTARTPVPVASLSKSMTALAVMRLVEAGRVDLDQPVHRYLPEFTMADRRAGKITVRQLLNQTSGMADSAYPDLTRPQAHTLTEAVADMRGARLAARPGTEWNYHNPNYFVAARLVEVVSGRPFADYLAAQVFRPLGMTHTESVDTTDDMPDHARGYVRAYGMLFPRSHPRWFTAGGHGVVTTADDLSQWLIAQNDQGVSAAGRRVVSARSVDVMHTPPKGREYAMGWSLSPSGEKPRQIRHTGQLLTHNAIQTLLPDSRTGIAIVTNTGMISGDDAAVMLDGLVDLAQGKPPTVRTPFTMKADYVLAVLTLLAIALGVLGAVRSRRWARRTADRPLWRVGLRMLPCAVPIVLFAQLTDLAGLFMNREGTLAQLGYAWPALVIWSAAAALASTVVIAARSLAVLRTRRTRVPAARGAQDERVDAEQVFVGEARRGK